jgi:hypothetical protein
MIGSPVKMGWLHYYFSASSCYSIGEPANNSVLIDADGQARKRKRAPDEK